MKLVSESIVELTRAPSYNTLSRTRFVKLYIMRQVRSYTHTIALNGQISVDMTDYVHC